MSTVDLTLSRKSSIPTGSDSVLQQSLLNKICIVLLPDYMYHTRAAELITFNCIMYIAVKIKLKG